VCFVLQKLMALLVSGAVVFASVGVAAAAPAVSAKPAQTSKAEAPYGARNAAPLPAGGAAGIQQAQGTTGGNDWILIGGGIAAAALILVLVAGGGDEDSPSSTGTN
jgi:hypothetical protein